MNYNSHSCRNMALSQSKSIFYKIQLIDIKYFQMPLCNLRKLNHRHLVRVSYVWYRISINMAADIKIFL